MQLLSGVNCGTSSLQQAAHFQLTVAIFTTMYYCTPVCTCPTIVWFAFSHWQCMMQEASIVGTIEDFMWLKLHLVQPSSAASMSSSSRQSPAATSSMLSPPFSITTLQVIPYTCHHWHRQSVLLGSSSLVVLFIMLFALAIIPLRLTPRPSVYQVIPKAGVNLKGLREQASYLKDISPSLSRHT